MRIKGRTAVITGASRGIGRAVALNLAHAGAEVALVARDASRLEEVAREVRALGRTAHVVPCDVSDPDAVTWAATHVLDTLGAVDLLVNAAGVGVWRPFMEISAEEHESMMATNYWGTFWWIRHLIPGMLERGSGTIVNVSSGAGKFGFGVTSGYSASKFAVSGLSEALYREYRPLGIRVCCVHPASVRTEFWAPENIRVDRIPPLIRYSPKMSPRAVARNVRWVVWTATPVRTFPVFVALLVRINALWIRAGDLLLWKWFVPALVATLVVLAMT